MMVQKDISQLASNYMEVWNAGKKDLLNQVASQNLYVSYTHFEKPCKGRESFKQILEMTHHYFPDLAINIKEIIPAHGKATVFWEYSGTHQNGNLFGLEANGKFVKVSGMTVLEIKNDLIIKEYGVVDNFGLAMQLGLFN